MCNATRQQRIVLIIVERIPMKNAIFFHTEITVNESPTSLWIIFFCGDTDPSRFSAFPRSCSGVGPLTPRGPRGHLLGGYRECFAGAINHNYYYCDTRPDTDCWTTAVNIALVSVRSGRVRWNCIVTRWSFYFVRAVRAYGIGTVCIGQNASKFFSNLSTAMRAKTVPLE